MSKKSYGTFVDSFNEDRTELKSVGETPTHGGDEMNISITQSHYPVLQRQDAARQNRLPLLCHEFVHWTSSSGVACILICLHLSIIGLFSLSLTSYSSSAEWHHIAQYLFSCGTFGFTGGCVNYLAVTLFFKRVPGLFGSGIVYHRYQDICESVRSSVINTFFERTFLELYSAQKLNQQIVRLNIEGHLQRILQSETVDQLIATELHSLMKSPEGQLLSGAGIKLSSLRPLVKPYVVELLTEGVPVIMDRFSSYTLDEGLNRLKQEVNRYTTRRKTEVSSQRVKLLIREIMYSHLNLLIVLGCAAGIFLGIMSKLTGVGQVL